MLDSTAGSQPSRLRRPGRHPRLVVGATAVLVPLPYLTGLYGPTEAEVYYWCVVILAVGVGLTVLDGDPNAAGWRRNPIFHIAALAVRGLAVVNTVLFMAEAHWLPFILAPVSMLAIAVIALAGRTRLPAAASRSLVAAQALLIAAAQYPAIWAWFHYPRLGDTPDPTPFVTHWAYAFPHVVLGALALWLAGVEVVALWDSSGDPPVAT